MTAEDDATVFYWPFCVGANKSSDYCLVAGPEFLIAEGRTDFFRTRSFGLTEVSSSPKCSRFERERFETAFASIYQTRIADLSDGAQSDHAGRTLYCAVGLIVCDSAPEPEVLRPILSACDRAMTPILERFLRLDEPIDTPITTTRQAYSFRRAWARPKDKLL